MQVGAKCLETCTLGAIWNVEINLKDIQDRDFVSKTEAAAKELKEKALQGCKEVLDILEDRTKWSLRNISIFLH